MGVNSILERKNLRDRVKDIFVEKIDYEDQPYYGWIKDNERLSDEELGKKIAIIHQMIIAGGKRLRARRMLCERF